MVVGQRFRRHQRLTVRTIVGPLRRCLIEWGRFMLVTGEMLRSAREEAGVSLREMAARIPRDQGYLSRIERDLRPVPQRIVDEYEKELGVDISRRTLLGGLAAGAVVPSVVTDAVRRMFEEETTPLAVDAWAERMEIHAADCLTVSAAEMQTRIAADLIAIRPQLTDRRMWAIASRLMVLHGAPLADVADASACAGWYRAAVDAADRSVDVSTRVWVRGRSALNMAHPSAALAACRQLAAEAAEITDTATVGQLMALVSLANVAALQGNPASARAYLDRARRVFDAVGTTEEASDYTMPEWRMYVDTSLVLARLGDHHADRIQAEATAAMPAKFARYATHLEIHRGLAFAKSGDRVEGVAHARKALAELPIDRHSVALRRLYNEVSTAQPPKR
ncbi:helix-turn-helix domain-containing protein [Nocardia sp. NPDC101769]|uniref:helix-turn-helix domain-containing protein n=1 Tax=Nocardia sp. NPDC101769 TaxID=3364333 RepID=UPI00381C6765